MEGNQSESIDT